MRYSKSQNWEQYISIVFYCRNDVDWCEDYTDLFYTEQDCWKQIEEDMDLDIVRIVIRKMYIGDNSHIDVEYNVNREVVEIDSRILSDEKSDIIYNFFDSLWLNFPVPFEKECKVV